jgi:uncharacterized protein
LRYYYLDTSALVKVYAEEPNSKRVRDMVRSTRAENPSTRCIVSEIAMVEAVAAIAKKERSGEVSSAVATRLIERILADFTGPLRAYVTVSVSDVILADAASHTRTYNLRGYDAMQLASALAVRHSAAGGTEFVFVAGDGSLSAAAQAENMNVEEV